jgi:branched-chain amino acid transport system ATP-binding protein
VTNETVTIEAKNVTQSFSGLQALTDVTIEFSSGAIYGVIGPNGAGKTTLLNVLSGVQRPTSGKVLVNGIDVTRWSADKIVKKAGVVRTFQTVRIFKSLNVRENVRIAARCSLGRSAADALTTEILERLDLSDVAEQMAANLSYGLQRRVELARCLACRPKVLLLDEPAAGLSQLERRDLARSLQRVKDSGVCVVLVEHHMDLVHAVCESCFVLDFGEIISSGLTANVMADERVISAYSGPARGGKAVSE